MEAKISQSKYLGISGLLVAVLIFNLWLWQSLIIGTAFGLAYLAFFSLIAGSIFIAKRGWHLVLGLAFLLSIISILGAAAIYFYQFNNYTFELILVAIPLLLAGPYHKSDLKEKLSFRQSLKKYLQKFSTRQELKVSSALAAAYGFIAVFCFLFLVQGQTFQSIQTPWQVVNPQFFLFYFIGSAILVIYLLTSTRTKLPLALISLHAFLSTAVALIVYGNGYGFDPFIHQATEKIILATGTISPKPLYYLGQYAIVIFLAKLTQIDYSIIDRALVPVLVSSLLPITTFYVFSHWLKKNYALVVALLVFTIPYTSFIMTAPQNLANLFFVLTILLSLLYFRNQIRIEILYLLALATVSIHPLAGIPLLVTVFLFHLFKKMFASYRHYLSLFYLTGLVFVITMPLIFVANGSGLGLNLPNTKAMGFNAITWVDKFDLPLNIVYLISYNQGLVAAVIIMLGIAYLANHKLLKNNAAYFLAGVVIFLNYLITKYFITFPELNSYDQPDFVNRLLTLSLYVFLPFFLIGLHLIVKNFWQKNLIFKAFITFILAGSLTVSLYLSYPHLDQYQPAKFFSLGRADLETVNYIEKTANPSHLVLANQMVGAAAIKTVGFKQYYNSQFFYSMPMGNPRTFYDYYLDIVSGADATEITAQAANEAGVEEVYFVINRYWNGSEKIVDRLRQDDAEMYLVDNGEVTIFKYLPKPLN